MRHSAPRNARNLPAIALLLLASVMLTLSGAGCQLSHVPPGKPAQRISFQPPQDPLRQAAGIAPALSQEATIRGQSGDDTRQPMIATDTRQVQRSNSATVVSYPATTVLQPPSVDSYGYAQGTAQAGVYPSGALPSGNYGTPTLNSSVVPGYPYAAPGGYSPSDYNPGGYGSVAVPGLSPLGFNPQGFNEAIIAPGAYPGSLNPGPLGYQPQERVTPLDIVLQEKRSGRILFGGTVNSDLGVAGQVIIEERNFDIRAFPRGWNDPQAFYGDGQDFRVELMPGDRVQRYTVSWSNPNLFGYLPYNLSVGGFYYTRQLRDWTEQRAGGRVALGYSNSRFLSVSSEIRLEDVKIFEPRISGVSELDSALGSNDIYTARFRIARDTRDSPFLTTDGSLLELVYDQVFGEYDYPRGQINFSRYFRVNERQAITSTWKVGITGSQTPIFENYFAGGYSTLRGFGFRGASPKEGDVQVGGELSLLGSLEYVFPLTADEMLRGVAFVDYGTVEKDLKINGENIRVAPGLGLRLSIPALGPAPLAFDFAYPVNEADTDERKLFSFFMGLTR
jgi:outer membrane protein insertion porin family